MYWSFWCCLLPFISAWSMQTHYELAVCDGYYLFFFSIKSLDRVRNLVDRFLFLFFWVFFAGKATMVYEPVRYALTHAPHILLFIWNCITTSIILLVYDLTHNELTNKWTNESNDKACRPQKCCLFLFLFYSLFILLFICSYTRIRHTIESYAHRHTHIHTQPASQRDVVRCMWRRL